jgi:hypothetical protein
MCVQHWISARTSNDSGEATISWHTSPFSKIYGRNADVCPSIITLVGRKKKASLLSRMVDQDSNPDFSSSHGTVRLVQDKKKTTKHDPPTIYVDCELRLDVQTLTECPAIDSCSWTRPLKWARNETSSVAESLVSNVLSPLSNVVCYFASDYGGTKGVSEVLARQATMPIAHNAPCSATAHVLVVTDTKSELFDSSIAQRNFHTTTKEFMKTYKDYKDDDTVDQNLRAAFHSIQVLGLQRSWDRNTSALVLRRRLQSLSKDVYWGRRISRYLFNVRHIDALSSRILTNFCKERLTYNLLRLTRPQGFAYQELHVHLEEFLTLIPNESWLWKLVVPVVASALVLASYPPGAHCKFLLGGRRQTV